ncbi:MAG: hypothetical protein ACSHYF_02710 [Verrucomicrobiaceae bacterium]
MTPFRIIAGTLWLVALVAAYHLGKQSPPTLPPTVGSPPEKTVKNRPSRDFPSPTLSDFDLSPELRNDLENHDRLWLLADSWASQDPENAVASLSSLSSPDPRNPFLFAALSRWATLDPAAAQAWLENYAIPSDVSRFYLNAALIRGLARRDPDQALSLLLTQPKSPERTGSLDFILGAWARQSTASLFQALTQFPKSDPALRLAAFKKALTHLHPDSLAEATSFSANLPPEEQQIFRQALASKWAQRDPEAALAWAADLTEPNQRALSLAAVTTHWARHDPLAASQWLDQNPESPALDLSARAIAWSTIGLDPSRAFAQITKIHSDSLRQQSFEQISRFWIAAQPETARNFLTNDQSLPPTLRESLLSYFE